MSDKASKPTKAERNAMLAEAVRNTQPQPVRDAQPEPVRNAHRSARRERDPRRSARQRSKEFGAKLRRQAIIAAIDQYAEAATGNRDFFLNKPTHPVGGTKRGDIPQ